ncbi:MAG: helix-turn-helix domain-containing protein [Deltaproteobacteria bacterium]|nr:helix-turn-helix domain-containing protein [Deltaproteobacteria bacterium]MBW1736715.1 helix-turn-helix domain-containing protein [Deltaproteobacteria bacterium]MBW1908613.1 helix-turn-helix domain-containing protein [Deltaproteobacteria bacterium]MBW2033021.1 helix-turn-helix domain-containing protein [Deltaproteobacteria bacterium]MBW2114558.1 helix-turn-helix domain-containing protein [Deltaproteobacteria bacterium]
MSHSNHRQTPEPETSQGQRPNEEIGENESPGKIDIGSLFRNEREKKGLSYSQISETTRLRSYILKALENEDWANLPAPVFVTGFIRSYARALGLDEGELVGLYQKTVPLEAPIPKPLLEPVRSKKPLSVFFVFLLLTMAVAYYLWKEYPSRQEILTTTETIIPPGDEVARSEKPQELLEGPKPLPLEKRDETTLMPESDLTTTDGETREVHVGEKKEKTTLMPQSDLITTGGETQDVRVEEKEEVQSSIKKPAQPNYEIIPQIEELPLTLTVHIRERTWIKIFVDDGEPKEYIFNPGSRPEWKARNGFDLLIGNAGGVDLVFNGEKIENLGKPGQVVRLLLPQYYVRRSQD